MKNNANVAQDWLKKAESDFANADLCISNAKALDTACFHCQQTAEKSLKAWLILRGETFPRTHDLIALVELCAESQPKFNQLSTDADSLNPYAVTGRYAEDFWPSIDEAQTALEQARRIYEFVKAHWT
jgi:HEPN domain-containing protein